MKTLIMQKRERQPTVTYKVQVVVYMESVFS